MGGITTVDYAGEKWGGTPHYRGKVYRLGDDEHGTWVWGPSGRTVSRGDQLAFVTGQDLVAVIPSSDWWSATWWLGHPEVSLYVNIQTPVEHRPGGMTYVDLDLDVVRLVDGTCEIVDQDEFELHRVAFGYPPDVVERTVRTAEEVLAAVRRDDPPFDGAAALRWTELARQERLPIS